MIIDIRHFQWQVFILRLDLRPEEVPICLDEPLLVVNGFCKHVGLVFAIDSLTPVLGQLVVAQVNVLRIIRFDEGLITTAFFKAREALLRAPRLILLIIVPSLGVSEATNSLRSHKLRLWFNTMHLTRSTAEIIMHDMVRVR